MTLRTRSLKFPRQIVCPTKSFSSLLAPVDDVPEAAEDRYPKADLNIAIVTAVVCALLREGSWFTFPVSSLERKGSDVVSVIDSTEYRQLSSNNTVENSCQTWWRKLFSAQNRGFRHSRTNITFVRSMLFTMSQLRRLKRKEKEREQSWTVVPRSLVPTTMRSCWLPDRHKRKRDGERERERCIARQLVLAR